jgi:hypothetical protein
MNPFLLLSLGLFVVWLLLFFFSKQTRRELIIMSCIGLLLSPAILTIVAADYRAHLVEPTPLQFEGFLFVFAFFGIASVVYEALFRKFTGKKRERHILKPPTLHWISQIIIIFGVWAFITLASMTIFQLSSVQSMIIGGLLIGTYVIADRKDLLLDALLSGAIMAVLIFLAEQFLFFYLFPDSLTDFWHPALLSGLTVGVVPLEEIMWAAIAGFALGPIYEYVKNLKIYAK